MQHQILYYIIVTKKEQALGNREIRFAGGSAPGNFRFKAEPSACRGGG